MFRAPPPNPRPGGTLAARAQAPGAAVVPGSVVSSALGGAALDAAPVAAPLGLSAGAAGAVTALPVPAAVDRRQTPGERSRAGAGGGGDGLPGPRSSGVHAHDVGRQHKSSSQSVPTRSLRSQPGSFER